jgi:hypothetical protein
LVVTIFAVILFADNISKVARSLVIALVDKVFKRMAKEEILAFYSPFLKNTGGKIIDIDPKNTSQACGQCGSIVKNRLSERTHRCPYCAIVLDRDAAHNIFFRGAGISLDALTNRVAECVASEAVCFSWR